MDYKTEGKTLLTRNEFELLRAIQENPNASQRVLSKSTDLSLGSVNTVARSLEERGLTSRGEITKEGVQALEPYKVDNAVIMAAGLSSRFAPLSFERPKGVLCVRGEVLIERQIRQLQEAGINDITVVVGYMKEEFFYLADEFNVTIVVNNEYRERNNNSTIACVKNSLGRTYICSSDDWFESNPFEEYVYDSYYAASFVKGDTKEWCLRHQGKDKQIVDVEIGGSDSWVMLGHSFWSDGFSRAFVSLLEDIYESPETADKLWEDIYKDHINELPPLFMKCYPEGFIWEFDSLDELRLFDPEFINNVDSSILDNICSVLECGRAEISDIVPIKKGMTNLSFKFCVKGKYYVYRHPGLGSEAITNRYSETFSQKVASELGIDSTFLYENPDEGWKISYFIDNTVPFEYHNKQHEKQAMEIARKLHNCGMKSEYYFDLHEDTLKQIELLDENRRTSFKDFAHFLKIADELNEQVLAQGIEPVLSHNDFYDLNFLVSSDRMDLIDWEYSGMSDYASDIAVFICCCPDYTYEEALEIFEMYFGREMTQDELFHCVAYSAVVSFHWFVWALYKDVCGEPVGEFLYYYYRYTKMFCEKAIEIRKVMS